MSPITDEGLPEGRYGRRPDVDLDYFEAATGHVLDRIDGTLDAFTERFPAPCSEDLVYPATDNEGWTTGFWTGMLWLAHELTGAERYREVATAQLESYRRRLDEERGVDSHDLGCIYVPSAVAAYRVTGDEAARDLALDAAERLAERYHEGAGVLQAWGAMDDPDDPNYGRIIVDSLIVVPLLYWASEATGDRRFHEMAATHVERTTEHLVREDASTYHTVRVDPETGASLGGETHQGHADDSCWARGQAWAVYGYPLSYRYTADTSERDLAAALANYYLRRLPDDDVPRWDFDAPAGDDQRDSSAAAIAACGLDELANQLPAGDPRRQRYENAALSTLQSLTEHYTTDEESNGVLDHAVYNRPAGRGVDECCIWGDYFYFEGLVRVLRDWEPYW